VINLGGVRGPEKSIAAWTRNYFRRCFSFSKCALRDTIALSPDLRQLLIIRSGAQRGSPSAFLSESGTGYVVRCLDGQNDADQIFHDNLADAATNVVLPF
jgi:hypothetical protein